MGNDVESTDSKSFTKFDIHAEIKAFWFCFCSLCVTYRGHHDATYPRIRIVISHSNQLFRYLGVTHNRRELSSRWDGSNEWHIFKYAACRPLYELSPFPSSSSVPSSMPSKCNPFRSISFWLLIQINIMEKGTWPSPACNSGVLPPSTIDSTICQPFAARLYQHHRNDDNIMGKFCSLSYTLFSRSLIQIRSQFA